MAIYGYYGPLLLKDFDFLLTIVLLAVLPGLCKGMACVKWAAACLYSQD